MTAHPQITDLSTQFFALVETDVELRQVHLRIARECTKDAPTTQTDVVGRIVVGGVPFTVYAEERQEDDASEGLLRLTNRELQIACLVKEGACNKQIARRLRISPYTVASYLKRMFPKLGCTSRAELAAMVAQVHPSVVAKAT